MRVDLMCHSGSDLLVTNCARVSFAKESTWDETLVEEPEEDSRVLSYKTLKQLKEKDAKLINYLATHKHWLPFRHPQITLRCKAPMFVARQLGKHQTGFSWSEESKRYIDSTPEFYWPSKWRKRADNAKQGSSDQEITDMQYPASALVKNESERSLFSLKHMQDTWSLYLSHQYTCLLESGVSPEQARMILPQNMYVNWVWTGSLLGYAQMVKARTHETAQRETQEFANKVADVIAPLYPVSWKALIGNL